MKLLFTGRVRSVALLAVTLAAAAAVSAAATPRGTNGQITFARFNPDLGDTQVYVVNPDGTGQRLVQAPTDVGEVPGGSRTAPTSPPAATCPGVARGSSTPTTRPSATSTASIRGSSTRAASRRPTGRCSSARPSATTEARTASTRSARRTAVASRRSPRTPAATTFPATGRRTGSGSSSTGSARTG